MLTTTIRHETAGAHASLEKVIIGHLKHVKTASDYIRILSYFHNFIAPVENKISGFLKLAIPAGINLNKAALLKTDLKWLGQEVVEEGQSANVSWLKDQNQAIGAMYVLEGSTLGSVHISKMIADRLDMPAREAINYFKGYGTDTMKSWDNFKAWMDALPVTETEKEIIVEAAGTTFSQFENSILNHVKEL